MRVISACLILLSCVAQPGVVQAASPEDLEKRFQEANAKTDAGEFQPALEIYNEILEAEPKAGNVWVMRAIVKWNLKDQSGARADLAQAISLHPDNLDAYRVRGQFRYQQADYEGSLADFDRAIELLQARVAALADQDAEAARTLEVNHAELFGMRAEVRRLRQDSGGAIRDLSHAIELKPDYVAAYYLRAQLQEAEGQPDSADADYSRTIELMPRHPDALNDRAWLRFHARRWDDAIADGRKALEVAPKAAEVLRVVGYAQFAKGDYGEAAKTLAAAADAEPNSGAAYPLFIRHHALLRSGGADQRLAASWEKWTDDPWVQALGRYLTGGLDEEALEKAAQDTPDDGELAGRACEMHFYIGLVRRANGDKSTARLRFQSALNTGQTSFVEDALSHAELARLK